MSHNCFSTCAVLVVATVLANSAVADPSMLTLNNNPFTRPDNLKKKSPRVRVGSQTSQPTETIELELTATMVSENLPMVIVNGEMLTIGEKIGEMKLVTVLEGEAIFSLDGKSYSFVIESPGLK